MFQTFIRNYSGFSLNYETIEKFIGSFRKSSDELDISNDLQLLAYYDYCLRFRHDIIHYLLSLSIFGYWVEEQSIMSLFPNYAGHGGDLTPDIVYQSDKDKTIYIIDVGCTIQPKSLEIKKFEKYKILIDSLKDCCGYYVKMKFFIYDHKRDNLEQLLTDFNDLFKYEFKRNLLIESMELFETKIGLVDHCDKKLLKKHKEENYSDNITIDQGKIKNTKIDPELLDSIYQKKYPFQPIIGEENEIFSFFNNYCNNESLNDSYGDKLNNHEEYEKIGEEIKNLNQNYKIKVKPTSYILYPEKEFIVYKKTNEYPEQNSTIQFMNYMLENEINNDSIGYRFLLDLFQKSIEILSDDNQKHKFCSDYYLHDHKLEKDKKEEYQSIKETMPYSKKEKKKIKREKKENIETFGIGPTTSFREFLYKRGLINEPSENGYVTGIKTLNLKLKMMNPESRTYYLKSGNYFFKTEKYKNTKPSEKTTTPLINYQKIDDFIEYLTENNPSWWDGELNKYYDYCVNKDTIIPDSIDSQKMKVYHIEEYSEELKRILEKNSSKYLWFNHHAYSQLMHFLSFSNRQEEYSFFNCGASNFLGIVCGGFKSNDNENAKAFMSCLLTKKPDNYCDNYGDITKIQLTDEVWLIYTNWRRLSLDKCTFIRDSFYSVLSTQMSFFFDLKGEHEEYRDKIYGLKSLISCCPIQQLSEFLMDNRYAYMSSFSSYTNISKLLLQKFKPPYHNNLIVWIINRILTRLKKITELILTGNSIFINVPEYVNDKRTMKSLGGDIQIPSLWVDCDCDNILQVVEEIFIYVLTPKEPSNTFHEKIKAVNTIIEYQSTFEKTDDFYKYGYANDKLGYEKFCVNQSNKEIGFSATIINHSIKNLINIIKPDFESIIDRVLDEDISEIVSTKAVIHSLNRTIEIETDAIKKKSIVKRFFKKMLKNDMQTTDELAEEMTTVYIRENDSNIYKTKERQKVWETIIDAMSSDENLLKVEDMVESFLKQTNGHVEADICIKSQYGSKREFYVVNLGAKAAARIVEKFFQYLCEVCPTECISVGGDKKMTVMQKNIDEAIKYCEYNNLKMKYVNGDCTKWSAAETMGSFIAMIDAMKDSLPINFYKLLRTIFSLWAEKKINIPPEILIKSAPLTDKVKNILNIDNKKVQIHSTHNFLQGMFNYSSSFKASSCNFYTNKIWRELFPDSKLKSFHNEHSDDYVQIIVYEKEEEFILYRKMFKLMMKFHGYNDSERKTSCQQLFMEFVSLISFNGQMIYPKIKKTKEINLSLPCTGYKYDMEAGLSRQGECLRMGANMSFCYYFQKSHNYCIREAYSLLKGMRNDLEINEYELPIELFGTIDQLPIFTLLCVGNINNYRLYRFGNEEQKRIICGLVKIAKSNQDFDFMNLDPTSYENCLFTPKFVYQGTITIFQSLIKHFNIDFEEVKNYWKENISDKIVKPKERNRLIKWMKYKFLDRVFMEAYTKMSRTKMTMRLSRYSSKKTIKFNFGMDFFEGKIDSDLYTIKECFMTLHKECLKNKEVFDINDFSKILIKSDTTALIIYSYLEKTSFEKMEIEKPRKLGTVGVTMPSKLAMISIDNNPGVLIQYYLNKENFYNDNRKVKSELTLQKDIESIEKQYGDLKKMENIKILTIYNDLMISFYKPPMMIAFDRSKQTIIDLLNDEFMNNLSLKGIWLCRQSKVLDITSPVVGGIYYHTPKGFTQTTTQQCIETIALLYSYLVVKEKNKTIEEIKSLIRNLRFKYEDFGISTNKSLDEILNVYNLSYFKQKINPIHELKIAGFLKYVFQDDTTILKKLVNSAYGYSRSYLRRGVFQDGLYHGETICNFKYFNRYYVFVQMDNEIPTMYTNERNFGINKMAYVIALRLANIIKEWELPKYLMDYDISKYEIHSNSLRKITGYNNKALFIKGKENYEIKFNCNNIECLPIVYVRETIQKAIGGEKSTLNLIPRINARNMTVRFGKMKLYTLPFWDCHQYSVFVEESIPDTFIEGIHLKNLLIDDIIYRFIQSKEIDSNKIIDVEEDDFLLLLKEKLKNQNTETFNKFTKNNDLKNLVINKDKIIENNNDDLNLDNFDFSFENLIFKEKNEELITNDVKTSDSDENLVEEVTNFVDNFDIEDLLFMNRSPENKPNDNLPEEINDFVDDFDMESLINMNKSPKNEPNDDDFDFDDLTFLEEADQPGILDTKEEFVSESENESIEYSHTKLAIGFTIEFGTIRRTKPKITIDRKMNYFIRQLNNREPLFMIYINKKFFKNKFSKTITMEDQFYGLETINNLYSEKLTTEIKIIYLFCYYHYLFDNQILTKYRPKHFWVTSDQDGNFILNEKMEFINNKVNKEKFKNNEKIWENDNIFVLKKKNQFKPDLKIIIEKCTFFDNIEYQEILRNPYKNIAVQIDEFA